MPPKLSPGDHTFRVQAVDGDFNCSAIVQVRLIVEEDPLRNLFDPPPENGTIPVAFLGESPAFRQVKQQIRNVAPTDLTVLLRGETGAGKSLAAQVIHALSPRSHQPFVSVNCGTLQPELVNSELFGHEPGAFTGAIQRRVGKFEQAEGGTLFLDERGPLRRAGCRHAVGHPSQYPAPSPGETGDSLQKEGPAPLRRNRLPHPDRPWVEKLRLTWVTRRNIFRIALAREPPVRGKTIRSPASSYRFHQLLHTHHSSNQRKEGTDTFDRSLSIPAGCVHCERSVTGYVDHPGCYGVEVKQPC